LNPAASAESIDTHGGWEKFSPPDSQHVHAPSQGFQDGGPNNITMIEEMDEEGWDEPT